MEQIVFEGFHALGIQRAGILAALLAPRTKAGNLGGIIPIGRAAVEHPAGPELGMERRILGVVRIFRLLLGVQVIEVAVELVETVTRRQVFVAITQMVLADLRGGISLQLQHFGNRRILILQTLPGSWQADLQQAGA